MSRIDVRIGDAMEGMHERMESLDLEGLHERLNNLHIEMPNMEHFGDMGRFGNGWAFRGRGGMPFMFRSGGVARRTRIFSTAAPDAICYHRNVENPRELFVEALWHGRNIAVRKERRLRRCVATMLIYSNPFIEILRGIYLSVVKREPRMVSYSAVYSIGLTLGIVHALYSGYYQK